MGSDAGDLVKLELQTFPASVAISRPSFRRMIASPSADVFVIRIDGELAADAVMLFRRQSRTNAGMARARGAKITACRVYSMVVSDRFRGRGLGRLLLNACIATGVRRGARSIVLEVAKENAAAIGLYESEGFVHHKHLDHYYGQGEHGLKMRKILP